MQIQQHYLNFQDLAISDSRTTTSSALPLYIYKQSITIDQFIHVLSPNKNPHESTKSCYQIDKHWKQNCGYLLWDIRNWIKVTLISGYKPNQTFLLCIHGCVARYLPAYFPWMFTKANVTGYKATAKRNCYIMSNKMYTGCYCSTSWARFLFMSD